MEDDAQYTYRPHRLRVTINPKRKWPPECRWCGLLIFPHEDWSRVRDDSLKETYNFHSDCYRAWRSPEAHGGYRACSEPLCGCWTPGRMPRARVIAGGNCYSPVVTTELHPDAGDAKPRPETPELLALRKAQLIQVTLPRIWANAKMAPRRTPELLAQEVFAEMPQSWFDNPTSTESLRVLHHTIQSMVERARRVASYQVS